MQGNKEIIYSELSYQIVGAAFKVFNSLGYGYNEKYFQKAYALELKKQGLGFEREREVQLKYLGEKIGKYYLDFLVENKIVVELKVLASYKYAHTRQVLEYLQETNMKLAILIYFTQDGVRYRRIINPKFISK